MKTIPLGTWVSESSDISGYIPGAEWLEFLDDGKDHVWKVRQPVGELWIRRFRLEAKGADLIFTAIEKDGSRPSWPIEFTLLSDDRVAVTHHGFRTVFRRAALKKPNQSPQPRSLTRRG